MRLSARRIRPRRPGGPHRRASTAIVRSMIEHAVPHRALGRPQHRRATSRAASSPADDELLAMAESLPIHVMQRAGPDAASDAPTATRTCGRGDAFLHNSPYHGNSHPADHVAPRARVRRRRACTASPCSRRRTRPTAATPSRRPYSRDGARRLRGGRADLPVRQGAAATTSDIEDIIRMCQVRIRVPEQVVGRLPRAARRGAGRRARSPRARRRGRLGRARRVRRRLVRLQRAAAWPTRSRRCPRGERHRATAPRPVPRMPDGIPLKVTRRRRSPDGDDRGRPARQPRLPALRPQPDRGHRAHGGDDRRLQRHHGHVPPNAGSFRRIDVLAARELRASASRGTRRAARSRPRTSPTASATPCSAALAELARRLRHGRGRPEHRRRPSGVISGHDPRSDDEPFINQLVLALHRRARRRPAPTAG